MPLPFFVVRVHVLSTPHKCNTEVTAGQKMQKNVFVSFNPLRINALRVLADATKCRRGWLFRHTMHVETVALLTLEI